LPVVAYASEGSVLMSFLYSSGQAHCRVRRVGWASPL